MALLSEYCSREGRQAEILTEMKEKKKCCCLNHCDVNLLLNKYNRLPLRLASLEREKHEGIYVKSYLPNYEQWLIRDVQGDSSTKALFPTPVPLSPNVVSGIKIQ